MGYILTFGRYNGWSIEDVFKADMGYVYWLSEKSQNPLAQRAADEVIAEQMLRDEETDRQLRQDLHKIFRQKKRPALVPYKHGHVRVRNNEAEIEMCTHKIHVEHGFTEAFHSADWIAVEIVTSHEDLGEIDEEEDDDAWKKPQPLGPVPRADATIWYPVDTSHELLSTKPMTLEQAIDFLESHLAK